MSGWQSHRLRGGMSGMGGGVRGGAAPA
jgi:hypothetical protein